MKRFLTLIICLIFVFCAVGCNKSAYTQSREEVTINLPTDNTVNGYRVSEPESSEMPDTVSGENASVGTVDQTDRDGEYCANKNSKVFHKSSCGSVEDMKAENRVNYSDRDELIDDGYSPCKRCNP